MSDVFISYARSTEPQAQRIAAALRGLGYEVWRDDEIPAHRPFGEMIEERLAVAKAVLVLWSADAAKSEWVRSEASRARAMGKLVQLTLDKSPLPMPFDQIQCANLVGWNGEADTPGWRKVAASVADLVGGGVPAAAAVADQAPLTLPSKPSIAVMPFANLSGDPEQDYFADGMVEEIVGALSRYRSIFVIGSGSTLTFKGKSLTPHDVGRLLGVRYVLEGSVRKAGGRVRIAVNLIDASDGVQFWADRFEDTLEDVFALQDRVALGVAGKIEPTVQQAEIRRASSLPTETMGAYDLYLRALPLYQTFSRAETLKARDLLDRAIALNPDFGPALAASAACRNVLVIFGWSDDPERDRRRGAELAYRAVRVGGDDAYVLSFAAAALSNLNVNRDLAATLIDRALDLNPGAALGWFASGVLQIQRGEPDLAFEHFETTSRLDPLSLRRGPVRVYKGVARFQQGRFAEALKLLKEAASLVITPVAPAYLAATYGQLGQMSEARSALALYRQRSPAPIETRAMGRPDHRKLFLEGIALADLSA